MYYLVLGSLQTTPPAPIYDVYDIYPCCCRFTDNGSICCKYATIPWYSIYKRLDRLWAFGFSQVLVVKNNVVGPSSRQDGVNTLLPSLSEATAPGERPQELLNSPT